MISLLEERMLGLGEQWVAFEASSTLSDIFFDDVNQKVCTICFLFVRSGSYLDLSQLNEYLAVSVSVWLAAGTCFHWRGECYINVLPLPSSLLVSPHITLLFNYLDFGWKIRLLVFFIASTHLYGGKRGRDGGEVFST